MSVTRYSERKHLEARLLASNEMLEARVVHERAEVHTLETLIRTGAALNAELSPERLRADRDRCRRST